jgi:predicted amidohydrolase YtcJ
MPGRDLRFRIEHAQHIAPEDIARFGKLGVIASMQMTHLADDGRWATNAIGIERMRTSWPMKSLVETGAVVALGSDWFVTQPSALEGTRRSYVL